MGSRGPQKTPAKVLKKRGTYQKCRRIDAELEVTPGVPSCPSWLNARAKKEWKRIVPILDSYGILAEADQATVEMYCAARATFQESGIRLERDGWTMETAQGTPMRNPDAMIHSDAHKRMMEAGRALGLSASARTAISMNASKDAKRNDKQKVGDEDSILALVG